MRHAALVALIVLGFLGLFMGAVWWRVRSNQPDVLLQRLRRGSGNKDELLMRLNLARGDTVTPVIKAFNDPNASSDFRATMLELLFKLELRAAEERIERVLEEALKSPDLLVRRKAAEGFATYINADKQAPLIRCVVDPDPDIRRNAYTAFIGWRFGRGGGPGRTGWEPFTVAQKDELIELSRAQIPKEEDPELNYLARSVVGREIAALCDQSMELLRRAKFDEAEALLGQALILDPDNHRARIRLVRHFLQAGDRAKALELADKNGALLRIPQLSAAPVIDGDPTDEVWKEAYTSDRFYLTVSHWAARLAQGKTRFYIGHHNGRLYVAVLSYEDDLNKLVVKHSERDSEVWRDDCCELFFSPANTMDDLCQFIINAAGAVQDNRGGAQEQNVRGFNAEFDTQAHIFYDRGYWSCEFAIDIGQLSKTPITADTIWGMNIMRARIGAGSEHCQWWPTFGQAHNYEFFPIAAFQIK